MKKIWLIVGGVVVVLVLGVGVYYYLNKPEIPITTDPEVINNGQDQSPVVVRSGFMAAGSGDIMLGMKVRRL